ncbi:unnamed protein product [Protopolystoma xenopodis]|uniref:Uncharacterized protein n=1 Tax=Protopolystoma xenopodis TaxID=117903 RepID=A0A448XH54_9PLAT|nr:unnamed protein product [Protopolystoma xenopodis]
MTDQKSQRVRDPINKQHDNKLLSSGIIKQRKTKPTRANLDGSLLKASTAEDDDRAEVTNLSSILIDSETMDLLKNKLNFSLCNEENVLRDILVEVVNISDKYAEETKRDGNGNYPTDPGTTRTDTHEQINRYTEKISKE